MKSTESKNLITALYCRLSQEDKRLGEALSIENQRLMLCGRITPERYDTMASGYEQEQSKLKLNLESIKAKTDE